MTTGTAVCGSSILSLIRTTAEPNGPTMHPYRTRDHNVNTAEYSAGYLGVFRNTTMKTIKSQLKVLCKEKVVDMNEFRFLKKLDNLRKYFGIPQTKVVQDDNGAWFKEK